MNGKKCSICSILVPNKEQRKPSNGAGCSIVPLVPSETSKRFFFGAFALERFCIVPNSPNSVCYLWNHGTLEQIAETRIPMRQILFHNFGTNPFFVEQQMEQKSDSGLLKITRLTFVKSTTDPSHTAPTPNVLTHHPDHVQLLNGRGVIYTLYLSPHRLTR